MFDLDGNGVVDALEFDKVTEIIMKGTTVAKKAVVKALRREIILWPSLKSNHFSLVLSRLFAVMARMETE